MSTTARDEILARIRTALADAPETAPVDRDYLPAHVQTGLTDLLAENLADYRATVHRAAETEIAQVVARLIAEHGDATLAVPEDLPEAWIPREIQPRRDDPPLQPAELETIDAVLTGAALAIAETGTIVLDTGTAQGRRILTLIPDHHICVIHCPDQVVASLPQALPRLDPARPQTWIAGPSATSDIELDRVEGVHGPRRLDVILVEG